MVTRDTPHKDEVKVRRWDEQISVNMDARIEESRMEGERLRREMDGRVSRQMEKARKEYQMLMEDQIQIRVDPRWVVGYSLVAAGVIGAVGLAYYLSQ